MKAGRKGRGLFCRSWGGEGLEEEARSEIKPSVPRPSSQALEWGPVSHLQRPGLWLYWLPWRPLALTMEAHSKLEPSLCPLGQKSRQLGLQTGKGMSPASASVSVSVPRADRRIRESIWGLREVQRFHLQPVTHANGREMSPSSSDGFGAFSMYSMMMVCSAALGLGIAVHPQPGHESGAIAVVPILQRRKLKPREVT